MGPIFISHSGKDLVLVNEASRVHKEEVEPLLSSNVLQSFSQSRADLEAQLRAVLGRRPPQEPCNSRGTRKALAVVATRYRYRHRKPVTLPGQVPLLLRSGKTLSTQPSRVAEGSRLCPVSSRNTAQPIIQYATLRSAQSASLRNHGNVVIAQPPHSPHSPHVQHHSQALKLKASPSISQTL